MLLLIITNPVTQKVIFHKIVQSVIEAVQVGNYELAKACLPTFRQASWYEIRNKSLKKASHIYLVPVEDENAQQYIDLHRSELISPPIGQTTNLPIPSIFQSSKPLISYVVPTPTIVSSPSVTITSQVVPIEKPGVSFYPTPEPSPSGNTNTVDLNSILMPKQSEQPKEPGILNRLLEHLQISRQEQTTFQIAGYLAHLRSTNFQRLENLIVRNDTRIQINQTVLFTDYEKWCKENTVLSGQEFRSIMIQTLNPNKGHGEFLTLK